MKEQDLKRAFRGGWILWIIAALFVVLMSFFVRKTNENAPPRKWDMGGKSFVPASSTHGNGYYSPVTELENGGQP
jgi:hypothetical protein